MYTGYYCTQKIDLDHLKTTPTCGLLSGVIELPGQSSSRISNAKNSLDILEAQNCRNSVDYLIQRFIHKLHLVRFQYFAYQMPLEESLLASVLCQFRPLKSISQDNQAFHQIGHRLISGTWLQIYLGRLSLLGRLYHFGQPYS